MTHYCHELTLDFGEVGYHHEKHPFRVRLEAIQLEDLIRDAENAHRVYELMRIERPGDVWDYVWVVPEALPPERAKQIKRAREKHAPGYDSPCRALYRGLPHPWPEGKLPFTVFDRMFHWCGDDTFPDSEAWLRERKSAVMKRYADGLWAVAQTALARLDWNGPLLHHELALARSHKHAFSYRDRASAIAEARKYPPNGSP